jgi:hypothetical protein
MLAAGGTSREIARQLGVSVKTVETHRAQLMHRIGIHDLAGLVRFAVQVGIVSPGLRVEGRTTAPSTRFGKSPMVTPSCTR